MNLTPPLKLESTHILIKKSFLLFRSKLSVFIPLGLISTAVGLVQLLAIRMHSMPLFALSVIASVVVTYIVYLAMIRVASDPARTTAGEALTRVEHFIIPAVWVSLAMILISLGGTLLFIIPGIIVSVLSMFSVFAVVIDHHEKTDAIMHSWHLVRGKWFAVFFRVALANIVFGLCSLVIFLIFWALGLGETPIQVVANAKLGIHTMSMSESALEQIVMNIVSLPLTISFLAVLYENLKQTSVPLMTEEEITRTKKRIKILALAGVAFIVLGLFISSLQLARTIPRFITLTHAPAAIFTAF
jgi:hypothetical protein